MPARVLLGRCLPTAVAVLVMLLAGGCGASSVPDGTVPGASVPPPVAGSSPVGPDGSAARPVSAVEPTGVGIRRLEVIDTSRPTAARPPRSATSTRVLPITVRYPISGPAADPEAPDAEPFGQWPLIVFAHGFNVSDATYAVLLHRLAATGFVVVTPEFPLSSSAGEGPAIEADLPEQPRDIDFLIDLLTGPAAPEPLGSIIEPGPVGVMGHSDGAQTVLLSGYAPAYRNRRIGAVVAVSGRHSAFGGRWFGADSPPLLVLQAAADELNPFSSGVELVERDPHAATLVAVDGVTHLGAVTDPRAVGPVARLVADTFAWRLRGSIEAQRRLATDLVEPPLRLVASHE